MRAEARVLSSGGSTKEVPGILCNSIELGRSELHLPPAADRSMLADWLAASGAGFRFSFKAPQRITHILRLTNSSEAVAALSHALAPVVSAGRMGVALFQLPPNFKADLSRLESFPFARYRFRKSKYSRGQLDAIANTLRGRSAEGEVFAYFKHEEQPTGALHAVETLRRLGNPWTGVDFLRAEVEAARGALVDGG